MNDIARDGWWLATLGRNIVWARLREREAGTAEVFDSDGATLPYDSVDTARAALMAMVSMGCKEACDMGMRLRNSVRRVANERGEGLAEGKSGARVLRGHAGLQRLR